MEYIFDPALPVAIGADHAGYTLKEHMKGLLEAAGISVADKGTYSRESVDYPDFAHPVAQAVAEGHAGWGILICGSGNGVCMSANKHAGIRAALCWNEELAGLAREHNNANILCIPARFVETDLAEAMVKRFKETAFEGGRHQKRVEKIPV